MQAGAGSRCAGHHSASAGRSATGSAQDRPPTLSHHVQFFRGRGSAVALQHIPAGNRLPALRAGESISGLGYGFFFVSANIIAYSQLRPDQNNRSSSLTNFFRNWGGSFGIALITTVAERRQQFHETNVGSAIDATSQQLAGRTHALTDYLVSKGYPGPDAALAAQGSIFPTRISSEPVVFHGRLPHPGVGHDRDDSGVVRDSELHTCRQSSGGALTRISFFMGSAPDVNRCSSRIAIYGYSRAVNHLGVVAR